jgi:hypothetical protein
MAGEKGPITPGGKIQEFSNRDELERALNEEVAKFRSKFEEFFNLADSGEESAFETATLASLDYHYQNDKIFAIFNDGLARKSIPINSIVTYFEDSFSKDRDFYRPVLRSEETGSLERLKPPISPKLGIFSAVDHLYLIRRNFVLKPQNGFQRGIEQIRVALNSDLNPEIGELWIAKRWRMNDAEDPLLQTPIDLVLMS